MSWRGTSAVLLGLAAAAVAALVVALFIYRSVLPGDAALPPGGGCALGVAVGLLAGLLAAASRLLRRRRRGRESESGERLRRAVLGEKEGRPGSEDGQS